MPVAGASARISRHHCVIRTGEGLAAVRDLGSSNGTFLNGQRLTAEQELKAGDHLQVGPLEFEVQLTVSVSGKRKPKVRNVQEALARTVETASGEEVDVSDWLEDEDDAAESGPNGHLGDTRPLPAPAAQATSQQPPQPAAPVEKEAKPGKPPPFLGPEVQAKKLTAETSREAAADMLKQFLRRKS